MVDVNVRVERIIEKVRGIARCRYQAGNYSNPYGDYRYISNLIPRGVSVVYHKEMHELRNDGNCFCGWRTKSPPNLI